MQAIINSRLLFIKNDFYTIKNMDNQIGKLIKQRLKELKQSQSWLAEKTGVSNVAVFKWIKSGKVSRENIQKVAEALNVPVDNLLGGEIDAASNVLEKQLLMFFRNISNQHQDDLISFANTLYSIDKPNDLLANPTNGKAKKEKLNQ